MSFYISIKKKLPGFELDIKLETKADMIGILGISGSGKTMTLRCIAGLVKPDEGRIIVDGRTLFDSEKKINLHPGKRKVGFVFQNYALFPHLTIYDNIAFGLDFLSRQEKQIKVDELITRFHLLGLERRYPSQISGGQQQRAALARAMAVEPEILLLDEPFSAIDEHLRIQVVKEVVECLKDFRGYTLFVTHNMEEAYHTCKCLVVINSGKVEAFGSTKDIFSNPPTLETARITGCKNISRAIRLSDNVIEIPSWHIKLKLPSKVQYSEGFVGIRSHHIRIADDISDNIFPAWIADLNESPFRMTVYLKFESVPDNLHDFHVQWEVSKEIWEQIKDLPQPLKIYLPSDNVFLSELEDYYEPEVTQPVCSYSLFLS